MFFSAVLGCQNDTLKFCNDTLNSEGQDMILPRHEVKRFEENMFSCNWLLQQTATMSLADNIFWRRYQLLVWYLCNVICTSSLRPVTFLLQICTVWCTKLRNHCNAIKKVFYCFTVAIGSPGGASDFNEDKKPEVTACM